MTRRPVTRWLGGAAFVGALALTAWTFFSRWSEPRRFEGWEPIALDAALLAAFALHHSLFARERVKVRVRRLIDPDLMRSAYVWVASLLLVLVLVSWRTIGGTVYRATGWRAVVAGLVQIAGLALIIGSVRSIDPLELAGIRVTPRSDGLQCTGPYRLVRHPLYLGWALIVFGAGSMTGDRLAFAVLTTFYIALAIPWEERSLLTSFGADYERYKRQVRWRLVPFLY
jgi:protein-S-isoprenylcysteine O-methyltransferase Ste14